LPDDEKKKRSTIERLVNVYWSNSKENSKMKKKKNDFSFILGNSKKKKHLHYSDTCGVLIF